MYMSERATVGIRELRQDLSRYLKRVRRGERLIVTERNKPVAMLSPLLDQDDENEFFADMIASGELIPATRRLEELHDLPAPRLKDPHAGSKALFEQRGKSWEDDGVR